MKKSIIVAANFSFFFAHTMQPDQFTIMLYGTTINVSKKSLHDIADTVNLIIVGKHQQQLLDYSPFAKSYNPGEMHFQPNILYIDNENYSDDETHYFFEEEKRISRWKTIYQHTTSTTILSVVEPRITLDGWRRNIRTNKLTPRPRYVAQRLLLPHNRLIDWMAIGTNAITEASKDLARCYNNVLIIGKTHLKIDDEKSIAIPALSTDVGFPREIAAPIAIRTIIDFLSSNAQAYDRIELCVKKRSEFATYKQLLSDYWQKPYFLYCAHKNNEHFLCNVPREIIDYILKLMHCAYVSNT
jgi:hypothetical protein